MNNCGPKQMPYVRLGDSGLKVSKLILGCMTYGSTDWQAWVLEEEEAIEQIKTAYEAGINTFDTANVYSNGRSEEILGRAIKQLRLPREEIVVMTKTYYTVGKTTKEMYPEKFTNPDRFGYVNQHGLSRKNLFGSVKKSLERLQLDYIDVLQCHRFDPDTPISETMHALHDLVKSGLVRYIGMSSCYAWQFHAMQNYALNNGLTPFISMQNFYNLLYREEEREMMPTLKHFKVGSIPWSPLARGLLARPCDVKIPTKRSETDIRLLSEFKLKLGFDLEKTSIQTTIKRAEEIANKKQVSMAQVSLAWVLHKEPVVAPVIGTTSLENLLDLIGAVNVRLTDEELKYLEEYYEPMAVQGHLN